MNAKETYLWAVSWKNMPINLINKGGNWIGAIRNRVNTLFICCKCNDY
jgi:hypothetical protein